MDTEIIAYALLVVVILLVGSGAYAFRRRDKTGESEQSSKSGDTELVEDQLRYLIFDYLQQDDCSLARTVNWMRASADPKKPFELRAGDLFLVDLVTLIRAVVLPKDYIRSSDAALLSELMGLISTTGPTMPSPEHYMQLLEDYRPKGNSGDWTVLTALRRREERDLPDVVQIYMSIAKGFADQPEIARERRQVGLNAVLKHLEEFLQDPKAGQEYFEVPAEAEEGSIDHRYQLLGATPGCTLEGLKRSYRRTVALWHPDNLENMAPELKAQASEKMKAINGAFESLSLEFAREIAQPPKTT